MELRQCLREYPSLADSALFRNVSPESIENTRGRCFRCSLAPGQVLIQAGQPNHSLFLLLEGRLRVQLGAEPNPVALVQPGEFVGELSLIDGQPASATVVADLICRLLMIPGEVVWTMARASPITRNLLSTLAERLRHKNDLLVANRQRLDECQHHATTDSLTGLRNRRWWDMMLLRQVERCRRDGSACSLLLIDVDSLKRCNDEQGHLIGDQILYSLARILETNLRPGEIMARFGGDEFVVLLPDTEGDEALAIGQRLCRAVAAPVSAIPAGAPLSTVSIGVSRLGPSDSPQDFIANADRSLYKAKTEGRNQVGPLASAVPGEDTRPGEKGVPAWPATEPTGPIVIARLPPGKGRLEEQVRIQQAVGGGKSSVSSSGIIDRPEATPLPESSPGQSQTGPQWLEFAQTSLPLFLKGENGVGKATMARRVHEASRGEQRFIPVNCRALSENELDIELFGCSKGSSRDRSVDRPGKLVLARQGTLYLDGAEKIPPSIWKRLLDTLENEQLGIRLIAAVETGAGKPPLVQDWAARLGAITLEIPPLRMRKEEIPYFCNLFLQRLSLKYGFPVDSIPEKLVRRLQACEWEGENLHDLKKAVRRYFKAVMSLSSAAPV